MLFEKLKEVNDEKTFMEFLKLLREDFIKNPREWVNQDISTYIECAYSWAEDTIEGTSYIPKEDNPWKRCAQIMYMGKIYE